MFLGLQSVVYPVADLAAAGQWYEKVFDQTPVLRASGMIGFEVGHDRVWLKEAAAGIPVNPEGATAFWGVSDIDAEVSRLRELGAQLISPRHWPAVNTGRPGWPTPLAIPSVWWGSRQIRPGAKLMIRRREPHCGPP